MQSSVNCCGFMVYSIIVYGVLYEPFNNKQISPTVNYEHPNIGIPEAVNHDHMYYVFDYNHAII